MTNHFDPEDMRRRLHERRHDRVLVIAWLVLFLTIIIFGLSIYIVIRGY